MTRVTPRWLLTVLLPLAGLACRLTDAEFGRLDRWLNCVECIAGERDSVRLMGAKAVSRLIASLDGPPAARLQRDRLRASQAWAALPAPAVTESGYVAAIVAGQVATWQKRAAISLGDIGGWRARRALDNFLATGSARADVLQVAAFVRATMDAPPFTGQLSTRQAAYGDSVTVTTQSPPSFAPDQLADLADAAFSATDVLVSRTGSQLRFTVTAPPGPRALAIRSNSAGATSVTAFNVSSLVDANDRAMLACANVECGVPQSPQFGPASLPWQGFVALARTPPRPDSIDLFRVQAGAVPFPITAELSWVGNADLDLRWRLCAADVAVGGSGGATAANPEQMSVTVGGAECWLLMVMMNPGVPGPAFARLRLRSP